MSVIVADTLRSRVAGAAVTTTEGLNVGGACTTVQLDVSSNLTVGTGITMGIAGVATFSGTADVHLTDNVKLNVGDSNDFQVSHDGSNTLLNNTTGALKILSDQAIEFRDSGQTEIFAKFTDNGSVDLYYDNNKKFETHNTGVKVTGIATISSDLNVAGITTVGILTAYESITVKVGAGSTELTTALSTKASTGKAIAMAMVFG